MDRAAAALISDLKFRGMLDETLVIWGGEFGRTPLIQIPKSGDPGRDHHRDAFSMILAGGGVRKGYVHGGTDDFCMSVVRDPVSVHEGDGIAMVNTPALHGLFLRAPYFHDGRARDLRDLLTRPDAAKHGGASKLTAGQIEDLIAYLESL